MLYGHICRPDRSGKMYTNYQVIGTNLVAVPTHFFKVIAYEDTQSQKLLFEVKGLLNNLA